MYPGATTHEPRAIGPLMRAQMLAKLKAIGAEFSTTLVGEVFAALGYCVPTANWIKSAQRQCHRRPMMIWQSLLKA
jgi:hypothetical protein